MSKPLRILVLMHPSLVPPDSLKGQSPEDIHRWKTEYGVVNTLRRIGHDEAAVVQTLLAIVDAQFVYAALDPMNTGAPATVPAFINQGELIKIDTRTGEYKRRV